MKLLLSSREQELELTIDLLMRQLKGVDEDVVVLVVQVAYIVQIQRAWSRVKSILMSTKARNLNATT